MRDASTFTRGTNDPSVASLRPLPENQFWLQAQSILGTYLAKTDYNEKLYVPAEVAPGKSVAQDLFEYITTELQVGYLLLVGQYGVGKSSSLHHLQHVYIEPRQSDQTPWFWIYFDANRYLLEIDGSTLALKQQIASCLASVIDDYLKKIDQKPDYFFSDAFLNDPTFAKSRQLWGVDTRTPRIQSAIAESLDRPGTYLTVGLRFLARHTNPNQVVLLLDNFDSQPSSIQRAAVNIAADVSLSCNIKTIVPVRRSTESQLKFGDPDVFTSFVQTSVSPPDMIEVIRRRLDQAMASHDAQNVTLGEGALRAHVRDSPEFVEVLVRGLSNPSVHLLLNRITNESVRQALKFAMIIYSSAFIDARRIIRSISPASHIAPPLWKESLPYYVVIKALLLQNYPIYRPDASKVGNLFGAEFPPSRLSPFLRIYMLTILDMAHPHEVPVHEFFSTLKSVLGVESAALDREKNWLEKAELIVHPDPDHLHLTQRGSFLRHIFMYDIEYLTHISTDVRMYPELCERLILPAETLPQRMNNLLLLLEFLVYREHEILVDLSKDGLKDYIGIYGDQVISARILSSCKSRISSIRTENDDYREFAVGEILQQVSKLEKSRPLKEARELIDRYK